MRNVSDKICRKNQNTHYILNIVYFPRNSCSLQNNVERCGITRQVTDGCIIRRMFCPCRIHKATNTHSAYVCYCFSTATLVARTRLNFTFILTLPVLFLLSSKSYRNFRVLQNMVHRVSVNERCLIGIQEV